MRFAFLIFLIFTLNSTHGLFENFKIKEPPGYINVSQSFDVIYQGWAPMRLNNFDPMDNRTFNMRYLMNKDQMIEGGPIFIFIGGEWTISMDWLRAGHFYDMAKNLSGLMIYTEHRYYGYTKPTLNLELNNMEWLSIDQALGDLANFIIFIKDKIPEVQNSKVILTGCSYGATIATWFMKKYPHLAQGAWSMSAPLNAQLDFKEYKEVVSEAIHDIGGLNCSSRIERGIKEMEDLVTNSSYELSNILLLCEPLNATNLLDVWSIFHDIGNAWAEIVQYASRRGQQIENNCKDFLGIEAYSDAEALAKWVLKKWRKNESNCYDNRWSTFIDNFSGTEWSDRAANTAMRQWLYQSCTEFGWYQTSTSEDIIFGSMFPPEIFLHFCTDLYDKSFTRDYVQRRIDRTNVGYGGSNLKVNRVYSTHGQYDPWRPAGVSKDINIESPTIILPGESHCADLNSISDFDTHEMRTSKERIFELVKNWLGYA